MTDRFDVIETGDEKPPPRFRLRRGKIRIRFFPGIEDDWRVVKGYLTPHPYLAIHRGALKSGGPDPSRWTVTHLPTGYAAVNTFESQAQAKRYVEWFIRNDIIEEWDFSERSEASARIGDSHSLAHIYAMKRERRYSRERVKSRFEMIEVSSAA